MTAPTPLISAPSTAIARARRSARLLFMALGIVAGTWGAHIPSVTATYGMRESTLAWVLLAAALGAVSTLFIAGRIVGWMGIRNTTRLSGLLMCLALMSVLHLPGLSTLLPFMLLFGASMSLLDVSINTEGSELEHVSGSNIMSNLHGMFSLGGMCGAALSAWMLSTDIPPGMQLAGVSAAIASLVLLAAQGTLPLQSATTPGTQEAKRFAWPRGLLLVIGLLIFSGMMAEGVMCDWSVLYLKQDIGMPQSYAAMGYASFAAAMALARFGGDALRTRFAEVHILRVSACVAAVAMALVLLCANPWLALIGFALVGAGLAPVAPILYNAATRVPGVSRAAAIASVTSIGYSSFMLGPPLIGAIASSASLQAALWVVVCASAVLALGAVCVPDQHASKPRA